MHEMHDQAGEAVPSDSLLTTGDLQRLIKVDKSTIYRMAESGRIPAVKVGRQWRFPEQQLQAWLHGERAPAAARPSAASVPTRVPAAAEALQAAADLLAEATGVMVVVTNMQGELLAEVARPCGLFQALHTQPGVMQHCIGGWQELAEDLDLGPRWKPTPLGFLCARSLFRVGDRLRGMVLAGGVAAEPWPPAPHEVAGLAAGLGLPAGLLEAHIGEVYRLGPQERDRVVRLLPRAAAVVSHLAAGRGDPLPAGTVEPIPETPPRSDT